MNEAHLRQLLQRLADGRVSVDSAVQSLRDLPFENLGFARVDGHRAIRCGFPEVIFCPGKTTADTLAIAERLAAHGGSLLATRVPPDTAQALVARFPEGVFNERARAFLLKRDTRPHPPGKIVILSAGTSDIPVAEEARVTAEAMDNDVITLYDVGVAGIHRLLSHRQTIMSASVVVVVAGMEGALASVVAGLVNCPVIATPTSVGYGASFGGIAPLLTMLNSCAAGVAVVNIDNGFGAGYLAAVINRVGERRETSS